MFFGDLIDRLSCSAGHASMRIREPLALMVFAASLSGCMLPPSDGAPTETGITTPEPTASSAAYPDTSADRDERDRVMDAGAQPANGSWAEVGAGLELRTETVKPGPESAAVRLITLRIDPDLNSVDVAYRPERPLSLDTWQAKTNAPVIFNGGYFTEAYVATGLVVAGGQAHGSSYGGFAGMLAVTAEGPEVRWLQPRPYDPSEPLRAALQSFPMLVLPGGIRGFDEPDGQATRRTAIAQDTAGRFLVIVAPDGGFTLSQLSATLVDSDLALDTALNLDGGASTGLIIQDPRVWVESFGPLPTVVTVRPRLDTSR